MTIVFYISSHGFGHASRQTEVIRALRIRRPEVRIIIRTEAPAWFFEASAAGPVEVQPVETDTGLAQIDSLTIDEDQTIGQAARFYERFEGRVAAEATLLAGLRPSVVVSDVPPLASAAAARAGIPSIAIANFTWDWMYERYSRFDALAPGCMNAIRAAYASTTRALRLPLGGGFASAPAVRDIAFVARQSRHEREGTRRVLGFDPDEPIVLASFGGHRLRLDYDAIARDNEMTLVLTDQESQTGGSDGHVRKVDHRQLAASGRSYEDLVAAADIVVTKPGYGIVSECIANGVAMLYTSRGHVPEYDVMVREMPRFLRCGFISNDDLVGGAWRQPIDDVLRSPEPPERAEVNGADVAAEEILSAVVASTR